MARGPHRHGTASVTEEETLRDVAGWLGELKKLDKFSSKAPLNVSIFQYFLQWPSQRRTARWSYMKLSNISTYFDILQGSSRYFKIFFCPMNSLSIFTLRGLRETVCLWHFWSLWSLWRWKLSWTKLRNSLPRVPGVMILVEDFCLFFDVFFRPQSAGNPGSQMIYFRYIDFFEITNGYFYLLTCSVNSKK